MLNHLNQPLQMIHLLKPLLKSALRHYSGSSTTIRTVQTLSVQLLDEWVTDHRQWKYTPKKKDKKTLKIVDWRRESSDGRPEASCLQLVGQQDPGAASSWEPSASWSQSLQKLQHTTPAPQSQSRTSSSISSLSLLNLLPRRPTWSQLQLSTPWPATLESKIPKTTSKSQATPRLAALSPNSAINLESPTPSPRETHDSNNTSTRCTHLRKMQILMLRLT